MSSGLLKVRNIHWGKSAELSATPLPYSPNHLEWMNECEVAQLCPTLRDPMDCGLPGSSIHGILQARVLEWVAISFSRGSSQPRDWTRVSRIVGRHFTIWAIREASTHLRNSSCVFLHDWSRSPVDLLLCLNSTRVHRLLFHLFVGRPGPKPLFQSQCLDNFFSKFVNRS